MRHGSKDVPHPRPGEEKSAVVTQYGALCFRIVDGKPQVLLITSRTRRRWIIPKGWPIDGATPAEAAAIEAWEEAGVRGTVEDVCIGLFSYLKIRDNGREDLPCVVDVYPLHVKSLAKAYPEHKQRRRKWFSLRQAAKKVGEPELRKIIREFQPNLVR